MPEEPKLQKFGDPFQHGDPDMPARNNAVVPHNVTCANTACAVEGGRVILQNCVCLLSDTDGTPHTNGTWCSQCLDDQRTFNLQKSGESGPIFEQVESPKEEVLTTREAEHGAEDVETPATLQGETKPAPDATGTQDYDRQQVSQDVFQVSSSDSGTASETTNDSNDLPTPGPVGGEVANPPRRSRSRLDR
jgi:hypothetical protein